MEKRKKRINKGKFFKNCVTLALVLFLLFIPKITKRDKSEYGSSTDPVHLKQLFKVENLHNSDSKFFGNYIITSISDVFYLYNMQGNVLKEYPQICANWISDISKGNLIMYSNTQKKVGVARLDSEGNLLDNYIVMTSDKLMIDPAICEVDDKYYFTLTQIEGNVNNADAGQPNGTYTVKLYEAEDLTNFRYVTDIISGTGNVEDIDLINMDGSLCIVYEKEKLDKGDSSISLKRARDLTEEGIRDWSEEMELIPPDCDHEPASFIEEEDGTHTLYYSSDKEKEGTSYMGAKIYKAVFDENYQVIERDIEIQTINQGGRLLYDVLVKEDSICYLFELNYNTDATLVAEKQW